MYTTAKTACIALLGGCLICAAPGAVARDLLVTVADETVQPRIIVPAVMEDQVSYAVADLQHYLQRMRGREVAVVPEDAPDATAADVSMPIYVGDVAANAGLHAVIAAENLGRDGFVLDVSTDGIRILGGSKFGTGHGVYELLEHGISGIATEAHINWAPWGYHDYMMSRLWWNPYADIGELRRDFVRTAYGDAYEPMLRYHKLLDEARHNIDPHTLHAMRRDLEAAAVLSCRDDVRVLDGVTLDPPEARWPAWSDGDDLHLVPLVADPEDAEWAAGPEVTAALPRGAQWAQRFRWGPHTLLVHAVAGERIRIWSSGSMNSFELQDPMHLVVASGVGVEDRVGEDSPLVDMPAPSSGIYAFMFASGVSRIHVSNRAAVIKASSATRDVHVHHWSRHYFFVPSGTSEFAFFPPFSPSIPTGC